MRNPFARLCGKIGASPARGPRQPVAMIRGGSSHPELCNLVSDWSDDDHGPWLGFLKVDGIRMLMIDGRLVTRDGAAMDCARHALPGLVRLEAAYGQPMFVDAEYVAADGTFPSTQADFAKGEGSGVVWIHDAIPLSDWMTGGSFTPVEERLAELERNVADVDSPFVGFLKPRIVKDRAAADAFAAEMFATNNEGLVLKRIGSPYARRRTLDWSKVKQQIVAEVKVLDFLFKGGAFHGLLVDGPAGKPLRVVHGFPPEFEHLLRHGLLHLTLVPNADINYMRVRIGYHEVSGSKTPRAVKFLEVVA